MMKDVVLDWAVCAQTKTGALTARRVRGGESGNECTHSSTFILPPPAPSSRHSSISRDPSLEKVLSGQEYHLVWTVGRCGLHHQCVVFCPPVAPPGNITLAPYVLTFVLTHVACQMLLVPWSSLFQAPLSERRMNLRCQQ